MGQSIRGFGGVLQVTGSVRYVGSVHRFRRLHVWDEAIAVATQIYDMTKTYPNAERFGLVQQMRRAAVSISSNIAEGAGRGSSKEQARFLRVAVGSLCELESQVELSRRLGYLDDVDDLLAQTGLLKARIITLEKKTLGPDT